MSNLKTTEANYLSQVEMAHTNSLNKEDIATILAEFTYLKLVMTAEKRCPPLNCYIE